MSALVQHAACSEVSRNTLITTLFGSSISWATCHYPKRNYLTVTRYCKIRLDHSENDLFNLWLSKNLRLWKSIPTPAQYVNTYLIHIIPFWRAFRVLFDSKTQSQPDRNIPTELWWRSFHSDELFQYGSIARYCRDLNEILQQNSTGDNFLLVRFSNIVR